MNLISNYLKSYCKNLDKQICLSTIAKEYGVKNTPVHDIN